MAKTHDKPTHVTDAKGANLRLTRHGMEEVIKAGGSVLLKDEIYSSLDSLPTDAELAETPEEKAAAADDIDAQIKALQARKASISTDDKPAKK